MPDRATPGEAVAVCVRLPLHPRASIFVATTVPHPAPSDHGHEPHPLAARAPIQVLHETFHLPGVARGSLVVERVRPGALDARLCCPPCAATRDAEAERVLQAPRAARRGRLGRPLHDAQRRGPTERGVGSAPGARRTEVGERARREPRGGRLARRGAARAGPRIPRCRAEADGFGGRCLLGIRVDDERAPSPHRRRGGGAGRPAASVPCEGRRVRAGAEGAERGDVGRAGRGGEAPRRRAASLAEGGGCAAGTRQPAGCDRCADRDARAGRPHGGYARQAPSGRRRPDGSSVRRARRVVQGRRSVREVGRVGERAGERAARSDGAHPVQAAGRPRRALRGGGARSGCARRRGVLPRGGRGRLRQRLRGGAAQWERGARVPGDQSARRLAGGGRGDHDVGRCDVPCARGLRRSELRSGGPRAGRRQAAIRPRLRIRRRGRQRPAARRCVGISRPGQLSLVPGEQGLRVQRSLRLRGRRGEAQVHSAHRAHRPWKQRRPSLERERQGPRSEHVEGVRARERRLCCAGAGSDRGGAARGGARRAARVRRLSPSDAARRLPRPRLGARSRDAAYGSRRADDLDAHGRGPGARELRAARATTRTCRSSGSTIRSIRCGLPS
jgi:hypothetical protein